MKNKINVLLTKKFLPKDLDFISKGVGEVCFYEPLEFDKNSILTYLDKLDCSIDVIMGPPPELEILDRLKHNLAFVQIPWSGVESLKFDDCENLSIPVANSHGNSQSVAEMAVSLLTSIGKGIPYHDRELRNQHWHRPGSALGFNPPRSLSGSVIGLFGYGAINQAVSKIVQGFNAQVICCSNRRVESKFIDKSYVFESDFEEFIKQCDYIVIGAPLTPRTKLVFNTKVFNLMKSNAYLINVSRGGIVCEESLFNILKSNGIGGAAIDTWSVSPPHANETKKISEFDFEELDNIILSPHRAGFIEGELPHLTDVIENFNRFLNNDNLINLINFNKGY
ncbi:hypothetical protein V7L80_004033 [Vibrio harveyi]